MCPGLTWCVPWVIVCPGSTLCVLTCVSKADVVCLLTRFLLDQAPAAVVERSHVFSSFFYKQLTRRDNASEDGTGTTVSQSLRRHQRVKTWTRHVDIFQKDFLFVPVNQE